jgi:hypothetical protein
MFITVDLEFLDHPKTHKLRRILKDPIAAEYVMRVWVAAARHHPDTGAFDDPADIEPAAGWNGDRGKLAAALIECGFLDPDGKTIHDWFDHAGLYLAKMRRTAERQRRRRRGGSAPPPIPPTPVETETDRETETERESSNEAVTPMKRDSNVTETDGGLSLWVTATIQEWRTVRDPRIPYAAAERELTHLVGKCGVPRDVIEAAAKSSDRGHVDFWTEIRHIAKQWAKAPKSNGVGKKLQEHFTKKDMTPAEKVYAAVIEFRQCQPEKERLMPEIEKRLRQGVSASKMIEAARSGSKFSPFTHDLEML